MSDDNETLRVKDARAAIYRAKRAVIVSLIDVALRACRELLTHVAPPFSSEVNGARVQVAIESLESVRECLDR